MFKIVMALVLILVVVVLGGSAIFRYQFEQNTKEKVNELFNSVSEDETEIKTDALNNLPAPVKKWLENSGILEEPAINSARSLQTAEMRLEDQGRWLPLTAEQYFTVDKPGFIWQAKINAAPLIHISGRDVYYQGKGNMLIKPLSLITIADSKGFEMDQGTLVRFLAEIVWIPSAALSDYITWEEINLNSAQATMSFEDITASGVFTFNDQGEPIGFTAERYRDVDGEFELETWSILMSDHQKFNGIKIPTAGEITWKLEEGDFTWYKFEIEEFEYNQPEVY